MGSSYFGEPNTKSLMGGNERGSSGSSSSSSRKGKKGNNSSTSSEKQPKQPQRGLGVAQLEKIRLTGQLGYSHHPSYHINPNYPSNLNHQEDIRAQTGYSSIPSSSFSYSSSPMPSYAYNPNIMMGGTDYERSSMRYGGDHIHTQPSAAAPSWNAGHSFYESRQPNAAKQLFNLHEQTTSRSKKHRSSDSNGSSSHNSESSDSQELDLELRLSL